LLCGENGDFPHYGRAPRGPCYRVYAHAQGELDEWVDDDVDKGGWEDDIVPDVDEAKVRCVNVRNIETEL